MHEVVVQVAADAESLLDHAVPALEPQGCPEADDISPAAAALRNRTDCGRQIRCALATHGHSLMPDLDTAPESKYD